VNDDRRPIAPGIAPDDAPIDDPYATRPAEPPGRAELSPLAISSIAALPLSPVGSIMAVVFGWYARREIERSAGRLRGWGLATAGIALGTVVTMLWGLAGSYWLVTQRHRADLVEEEDGPAPEPRAPIGTPRGAPMDVSPWAPRHTKVRRQGEITLVDVGASTTRLADELAKQRAEAASAGETLVVMTTSGECTPCRGVDRSLADPLLQDALRKVRLVRVDVQVFGEDLEELRVPRDGVPYFYLPAPDLTPRDAVHGGEWDDDVPVNIAPVLRAFVRGTYEKRRHPWTPLPPTGITL
jgi:hypothetical protein